MPEIRFSNHLMKKVVIENNSGNEKKIFFRSFWKGKVLNKNFSKLKDQVHTKK